MKHTVGSPEGTEASRPHPDVESGLPPGRVLGLQVCCSLKEDSAFWSTSSWFLLPHPPRGLPEEEGLWGRRQSVKERGGQGRVYGGWQNRKGVSTEAMKGRREGRSGEGAGGQEGGTGKGRETQTFQLGI